MKRVEPASADRRLESIAARARQETSPEFDVSQAVLRRLRLARANDVPERPMLWMTAGAIAVAALVVVLSMPYLSDALDPLTIFLEETAASAI